MSTATKSTLNPEYNPWRSDFMMLARYVRDLADDAYRHSNEGSFCAKEHLFAYGHVYYFMKGIAGELGVDLPDLEHIAHIKQ